MNRQQQIDAFLFKAHEIAVARLRQQPERLRDVAVLLERWRERNGPTRADRYRDEWARLIEAGVDAIEREACVDSDHAAALRNVSPLSVLLSQHERSELLRGVRGQA
jgi:hypothetical protein